MKVDSVFRDISAIIAIKSKDDIDDVCTEETNNRCLIMFNTIMLMLLK